MKKILSVKNLLLAAWTLFVTIGILKNMSHYSVGDWLVILLIMSIPYVIVFYSSLHKKKAMTNTSKNNETEKHIDSNSDLSSFAKAPDLFEIPHMEVKIMQQEVPQHILRDMSLYYTNEQAANDMRIVDESLKIMEKTSDIDIFLSRYKTAMTSALTLEQAKKAGIPIQISDNFSKSLVDAKVNALKSVLYRSFENELRKIGNLKTDDGKLNRLNKYQQKLENLYESEFEFVAEDSYNDIMQKIESIKKVIN